MSKTTGAPRRTRFAPFRFFQGISSRIYRFMTEEEADTPLPDAFAKTVQNPEGLWVHVDALRKHLMRAVLFLMVTTALSLSFAQRIMDVLARPIGGIENTRAIGVTEPVGVFMKVSLLAGFVVALPYIALEMWAFIAPGVSRRSRLLGLIAIPAVVLFFVGGMTFTYFFILPTAIPFLTSFMGIPSLVTPSSYFSFVTGLMFWIGLAFEFPLVIFILAMMGLVRAKTLAKQWRLAIVVIAVLAALITPTVDPVNMSLVMGPLIILYFISIGLAFLAQPGRS